MEPELTTVADDEAVVHIGSEVRRYSGLSPGTTYNLDGVVATTLPRPPGARLATVATVNDLHFGEVDCGLIEGTEVGPVLHVAPGDPPYPDVMNEAAIREITSVAPDVVVAKGDLTTHGTVEEYESFLTRYQAAFGPRLLHVRGNHDVCAGAEFADSPTQRVDLPGVTIALLDTAVPGQAGGRLTHDQIDWLDDLGASADRPVLLFGHHHPWDPASQSRSPMYFGINPEDSERLVATMARRSRLVGYFAGHTHRNRVRRFADTQSRPMAEVASVKDFPGSWAEYRIFEGGILQIHRRISDPAALRWTDFTRTMFFGHYAEYSFGTLADRCFPVI